MTNCTENNIQYLHEQKKTIIISIDGNIGSGKSTLVKNLKTYYNSDSSIYFLEEPVAIWETITDKEGHNILKNYYEDQNKYAFPFQMMAYISRLALLREALTKNYKVIITERCVYTDKMVFAKMLYDANKIGEIEYKIYNLWFDEFIKDLPKFHFIYVETMPEIADERVLQRNRPGENIPLEYLKDCHNYHNNWLSSIESDKILKINGNININTNAHILNNWYSDIDTFIKASLK